MQCVRPDNGVGNILGVDSQGWHEGSDYRVDTGIVENTIQRVFVGIGIGAGDEIHRIAHAGLFGKPLTQPGLRILAERRYIQPLHFAGVGDDDSGAARIGHDGDAIAFGQRLLAECHGIVEKLFDCLGTNRSRLRKDRIRYQVGLHQGAGV